MFSKLTGAAPLPLKKLELTNLPITPDTVSSSIRHLQKLELLGLKSDHHYLTLGSICNLLQRNGITLTGIATNEVKDYVLLSYLASNPGFKTIRFEFKGEWRYHRDWVRFLHHFYSDILPVQRETLEDLQLQISDTREISEFPLDDQIDALSGCKRLRALGISCAVQRQEFEQDDTSIAVRKL
jgi:hypothetical protein